MLLLYAYPTRRKVYRSAIAHPAIVEVLYALNVCAGVVDDLMLSQRVVYPVSGAQNVDT